MGSPGSVALYDRAAMGTDKRERKKANRAAKVAAEEAAAKRRRRITTIRNLVILVIVVIVLLFLLSGCGTSDDAASGAGDETATTTTAAGSVTPTTDSSGFGTTPCPPAEGTDEPVTSFPAPFENCLTPGATYTATFDTTAGTIVVDLDAEALPVTVNNFVALARSGFYTQTDLHRVVPDMGIIQGGSPHTQDAGDQGPGYTIIDEGPLVGTEAYGTGILAMARTQAPDSASAQFFFLGNESGRYLGDPSQPGAGTYRVFGHTTEGTDVLAKILANTGDPVVVTGIEITES